MKSSILIVDDSPKNIQVLGNILRDKGYNIYVATSGAQALELVKTETPDLILLDVQMPEMDGYEVCKRLKESGHTTKIPVIFLTANVETDDIVKGFEIGAADYITKPFQSLELLVRVKTQIENKKLKENLEEIVGERTTQLRNALRIIEISQHDLIDRLGRAAEFKDNETGMHVKRMSHYCVILGRAAKLDETKLEMLLSASMMHDVGKIGIADNILLKPGKLTPEEFEVMKTHTTLGAELLSESKSELLKMAESIALSHHEKWNGKGYPNGLSGENIPIEVRIVSIADVFDALTSERPYKKGWSVEDAINFIQKEKGQHFDPILADLFLEQLPAILEIKQKFLG
ncbi:MAG: response regulator [Leptospiraceae bacterium]|nr:response regulator [Leptospiraceae bacterium]